MQLSVSDKTLEFVENNEKYKIFLSKQGSPRDFTLIDSIFFGNLQFKKIWIKSTLAWKINDCILTLAERES